MRLVSCTRLVSGIRSRRIGAESRIAIASSTEARILYLSIVSMLFARALLLV